MNKTDLIIAQGELDDRTRVDRLTETKQNKVESLYKDAPEEIMDYDPLSMVKIPGEFSTVDRDGKTYSTQNKVFNDDSAAQRQQAMSDYVDTGYVWDDKLKVVTDLRTGEQVHGKIGGVYHGSLNGGADEKLGYYTMDADSGVSPEEQLKQNYIRNVKVNKRTGEEMHGGYEPARDGVNAILLSDVHSAKGLEAYMHGNKGNLTGRKYDLNDRQHRLDKAGRSYTEIVRAGSILGDSSRAVDGDEKGALNLTTLQAIARRNDSWSTGPDKHNVSKDVPLPIDGMRELLKARESSGDYKVVNRLGYLGAYQFGAARLIDMGLVKKGAKNKDLNDPSAWTGKYGIDSKDAFLSNNDVQDQVATEHLVALGKQLKTSSTGVRDLSGRIMAAHLLGAKGSRNLNSVDANGTKGLEYYNMANSLFGAVPIKQDSGNSDGYLTTMAKNTAAGVGAMAADAVDALFDMGAAAGANAYEAITGKTVQAEDLKNLSQLGFVVDADGNVEHKWSYEKGKDAVDSKKAYQNLLGVDNSAIEHSARAYGETMDKVLHDDSLSTYEKGEALIGNMWDHIEAVPPLVVESFVYMMGLSNPLTATGILMGTTNQHLEARLKNNGGTRANWKEVLSVSGGTALELAVDQVANKLTFGLGKGLGAANKAVINGLFNGLPKNASKALVAKVVGGLAKKVLGAGVVAAEEGGSEALQEAMGVVLERMGTTKFSEKEMMELFDPKALKAIREAGYMGMFIGHGQAAMGKGLSAVGYGAGASKKLASKVNNKFKKDSPEAAKTKVQNSKIKKVLQDDLSTRGPFTDTVDFGTIPDDGLVKQFKEIKVLHQAAQQVGDDKLENEYSKRLKLLTAEVGKRIDDRKGNVDGLADSDTLGNSREATGGLYQDALEAAKEAVKSNEDVDASTAKLIQALGGLGAVNSDNINDNVKEMLTSVDEDLADVMTAEFVDSSDHKDTIVGKFVKERALGRIEKIENTHRDTTKAIQKLQTNYATALRKIGKSKVKDGTATKGEGDTDYKIGLRAIAAGENIEALRDLVGETSDAGVTVKDVIQHLIARENKEDTTATVVGKKTGATKSRLSGLIKGAKKVGAKIGTKEQKAGYETLVSNVAKIGNLRAEVEGETDHIKLAEGQLKLDVLEKNLNKQLISNTLFDKKAVISKLDANVKILKRKLAGVEGLNSKKDLQAFMKTHGNSVGSAKVKKAVNTAIKKMKAGAKFGSLSKNVRTAILRGAGKKRTAYRAQIKGAESAIRFVGLERYNQNSVKNGALDTIVEALSDKEVTAVKSIEKRKVTKKKIEELQAEVKAQIEDDTGLESQTVEGKIKRKVTKGIKELEKKLKDGMDSQAELKEAYVALKEYKATLAEQQASALEGLEKVHNVKDELAGESNEDAFQALLLEVINEHDGVLNAAAVTSFITRAKSAIKATERKIELIAQFENNGMPTVETLDKALEAGVLDEADVQLLKEVRESTLDDGEMKVFGELVKFMYNLVPGMEAGDVLADEDVAKVLTSYLESRVDMLYTASKVLGSKSPIKVTVEADAVDNLHSKVSDTLDRMKATREAVQDKMKKELTTIRTAKTLLAWDKNNKELSKTHLTGLKKLLADSKQRIKDLNDSLKGTPGRIVDGIENNSLESHVNAEVADGIAANLGGVAHTIQKHLAGKGNAADVTEALNSVIALTDLVSFDETMSNSIDFDKHPLLKGLADDVNDVLSGAFYKGDDIQFNVHLYAKNPVQRALMTVAEGANKKKLNEKDIVFSDQVAFTIHTAAMAVLDTELLGWVGYKDDEQLGKFFGNPDATPLPNSNAAGKLRHAYPVTYAYEHAGKILAKSLGMKMDEELVSPEQRAAIYSQLGHIVVTYMKQAGYLEKKEMTLTVEEQNKFRVNKLPTGSGSTYNFLVVGEQYKGKNIEKLRKLIADGGIEDFLDVFMPDREANKKFDTVATNGNNASPKNTMIGKNLPATAEEATESAENTGYELNQGKAKEVLADYDKLIVKEDGGLVDVNMEEAEIIEYVDEKQAAAFFAKFGVMTPKDIVDSVMLYDDRNAAYENYRTFVKTLEDLRELDSKIDVTRKGVESVLGKGKMPVLPVYTKYFFSKNGRFFMDAANGLNPQTEKELARWLLTPSGTVRQVVTAGAVKKINDVFIEGKGDMVAAMRNEQESRGLNAAVGVAQAFGHGIDKSLTTESIGFGATMMQMSLSELESIKERLANGEDVNVDYKYRVINFVTGKESGVLTKSMTIGKEHEMQRQVVLDSLINRAKGGMSLNAPYEIDGVTNGTYFKTAEAPVIEGFESMLSKTGFYTESMKIFGTTFGKLAVRPSAQDVIALTRHISTDKNEAEIRSEIGFTKLVMSPEEKKFFNDAYVSIIDGFESLDTAEKAQKWAVGKKQGASKNIANSGIVAIPYLYGNVKHFMPSAKDVMGMVTKAFRDFVKYPKMIFDYGGAVKNIRKAFVNDITKAVLNNVLTEASELLASEGDIDRKKYADLLGLIVPNIDQMNDKSVRTTFAAVVVDLQKMDIEKGVKLPKIGNMKAITLTNGKKIVGSKSATLYSVVTEMVDALEGQMIQDKLLKDSSTLIDYNNTLNTAAKWMGHIFKSKLATGLDQVRAFNKKALEDKGIDTSTVHASLLDPSIRQVEELIQQLDRQGFTPVVKAPGSSPFDGSGIELIDTKVAKDSTSIQAPLAYGAKDGKNSMSKTVSTILKEPAVVHALASVADTHFSDGAAMAELLKRYGVTPIHDATVLNGAIADRVSELYGEKSFEIMMKHSPVHTYAEKLQDMASKLTMEEMDVLIADLSALSPTEQVVLPARYAMIDEKGVPTYGSTVQEEIAKEDQVKVTTVESLLEQMRRWGLLVVENKEKLLSQDVYITQLAGAVNGEYAYTGGTMAHGLSDVVTDVAYGADAINVESGPISEKALPKQLFATIWNQQIKQAITEIATVGKLDDTDVVNEDLKKAIAESDLGDNKKYWGQYATALGKFVSTLGQREGSIRKLVRNDLEEFTKLLPSAARDDVTPFAVAKLYNEFIVDELIDRGLGSLDTWVEESEKSECKG